VYNNLSASVLTPSDEVVRLERRIDVEDSYSDATVQEQSFDEHPRYDGEHRVPVERAEHFAQPVLQAAASQTVACTNDC